MEKNEKPVENTEMYEVAQNLNIVKQKIEKQKSEILKCENIIQQHQNALSYLKDVLNQFNEVEILLEREYEQFLNITNNSCDNNHHDTSISSVTTKPPDKSLANEIISTVSPQFTNTSSKLVPQTDLTFNDSSKVCASNYSGYIHPNHNDQTIIDNLGGIPVITGNDCSVRKRRRRRKCHLSDSEIKIIKLKTNIKRVLRFKENQLTSVGKCKLGLIFSGTNGLLQLRDANNFKIIRNYEGYGSQTVVKFNLVDETIPIILSYSQNKFIAFDLENGSVLKMEEYQCDICSLTNSKTHFFISNSGFLYKFTFDTFKCFKLIKLPESDINSNILLADTSSLILGYENGKLYKIYNIDNLQSIKPIESSIESSISDIVGLWNIGMVLIVSRNSLQFLKKYNLAKLSAIFFTETIRKVLYSDNKLFVLTSDGTLRIYTISETVTPTLEEISVYQTNNSSLRDMCIDTNIVYLIGQSKAFRLRLSS